MDVEINLINQFKALPENWNAWLLENLERGCHPEDLAKILLQEGLIELNPVKLDGNIENEQNYNWLEQLVAQKQSFTPSNLNSRQKKWIAEAVLEEKPKNMIYQTLKAQGLNEIDIAVELVELKQNPYFQIAQQQHFLVKKRNWLLDTLDRFARLNPSYTEVKRISTPYFEHFVEHYYSRNLPVLLTNAIDHWNALKKWSPQYFKQTVGHQEIEVQFNREQDPLFERNSIQHKTKMSMNQFVELVEQNTHTNNFYMTANNAKASQSSLSELFKDIGDFHNYTNHHQVLDRSFIWFGPKGAFTPLHHDLTNNFLVQIYGRKKVTLIPSMQVPHLYNDVAVFSQIANPHQSNITEQFPELNDCLKIECILNQGESLFIPMGWWHCVESLDTSISVSFTHFNLDNGGAETFPQPTHID
ncbi:cupin-like domain-containing protein [Acinetobacter modestus]|uniref:cupin-like domain-containing protein n=1 Tax=Acinetobacter modestus TaxID=1776740 RepID=UPI00301A563B